MKILLSKRLALAVALIMAALVVNPALAKGKDKNNFKFHLAGGFVQNIQQMQVDEFGVPTGVVESRAMALGKGKGKFGHFDVMAISVSGPPLSAQQCAEGFIKVADIVENNLVMTFHDLSLLYGNGTGIVCLDLANPDLPALAEIEGTFDGGTGRFKNAEGIWTVQFDVFVPVGETTQFFAEAGVVEGTLTKAKGKGDD
ncbi:hypothetical protein ACFL3I_13110 [Pseudomonadota bacterium]